MDTPLVVWLRDVGLDALPRVGGKNASLGEMLRSLAPTGVRVPEGFALTTDAFRLHLRAAGLEKAPQEMLSGLDPGDTAAVARAAEVLRRRVSDAPLPPELADAARTAYARLCQACGEDDTDVAVRSSATAEDLPAASFAGLHETYLGVRGWPALERAIRACMASLFTDRAIVYRAEHAIRHEDVALSVGVQKMVRSDLASAGVIFTLETESGCRDIVLVTGAWGLGEVVVQGRVNPDEWWVHKGTLRRGFRSIVRRRVGDKAVRLVYDEGGGRGLRELPGRERDRRRPVLGDDEVLQLARWALDIEDHYSRREGRALPMDIEWAKDGRSGLLYVVQARPETVHAQRARPHLELHTLRGKGPLLLRGRAVGSRIGAGPVRIVRGTAELGAFQPGDVLVAEMTDPDWDPVLRRAAAVVTDQGGRTCHAAIVAREIGIPCVVGAERATHLLRSGQDVTVSCAHGEEGRVYDGKLAFEREDIDLAALPRTRVPLMLNLANPERAFELCQLPCAGVGLLRIEFLVSNWIGVHPMALLHPERVEDAAARAAIAERVGAAGDGPEFFVERMASGVGQIAAAFHPRPVIVRFSDFKTDEYAGLLGGRPFEPVEANPMIGWRGASRYYDDRYREGFALECAAIRRVREEMGLENVAVMIPFCRTLEEGRRVLAEMEKSGLARGARALRVYVMCEIPNNVVLAEEFAELFDGFSIGSNDLTQLTLGVDRNSERLAHVFDERDPGVKALIARVIEAAHRKQRVVGLCGEAPSNDPAYAAWLADQGIDSISLNPDALPRVARLLAAGG
jgi:pyruvate,water dikinase